MIVRVLFLLTVFWTRKAILASVFNVLLVHVSIGAHVVCQLVFEFLLLVDRDVRAAPLWARFQV